MNKIVKDVVLCVLTIIIEVFCKDKDMDKG